MHVSPCGWYCFESSNLDNWVIEDTQEKTELLCKDESCRIELLCARKATEAIDDEISQIHEDYLSQEGILPEKTVLSENDYKVKFYVTKGTGLDEMKWIVGHAFWNNYCVFLQYRGDQNKKMSQKMQVFYDVLNSLQPLSNN